MKMGGGGRFRPEPAPHVAEEPCRAGERASPRVNAEPLEGQGQGLSCFCTGRDTRRWQRNGGQGNGQSPGGRNSPAPTFPCQCSVVVALGDQRCQLK
jgi:hypothetical protein